MEKLMIGLISILTANLVWSVITKVFETSKHFKLPKYSEGGLLLNGKPVPGKVDWHSLPGIDNVCQTIEDTYIHQLLVDLEEEGFTITKMTISKVNHGEFYYFSVLLQYTILSRFKKITYFFNRMFMTIKHKNKPLGEPHLSEYLIYKVRRYEYKILHPYQCFVYLVGMFSLALITLLVFILII